jgi:hypothetical protein
MYDLSWLGEDGATVIMRKGVTQGTVIRVEKCGRGMFRANVVVDGKSIGRTEPRKRRQTALRNGYEYWNRMVNPPKDKPQQELPEQLTIL